MFKSLAPWLRRALGFAQRVAAPFRFYTRLRSLLNLLPGAAVVLAGLTGFLLNQSWLAWLSGSLAVLFALTFVAGVRLIKDIEELTRPKVRPHNAEQLIRAIHRLNSAILSLLVHFLLTLDWPKQSVAHLRQRSRAAVHAAFSDFFEEGTVAGREFGDIWTYSGKVIEQVAPFLMDTEGLTRDKCDDANHTISKLTRELIGRIRDGTLSVDRDF